MEEFATKFADQLENVASKIRSQTIDRADRFTSVAAAALIALVLAPVILIFLSVAIFRVVEAWTSNEGAFAIFGGLFLAVGALLWKKKNQPPTNS